MAAGDLKNQVRNHSAQDERMVLFRVAANKKRRLPRPKSSLQQVSNATAFRLENYKHGQKMDLLEKERQQCIHRLKEDRHIFKMSVRLPKDAGNDPYMEKYGGTFRANGEYRGGTGSATPSNSSKKANVKKYQCTNQEKTTKSPIKCKTVADIIAFMRTETPFNETTMGEDQQALPSDSSSRTADHNDNLRLLLENYEMFVPNNVDMFGEKCNENNEPEYVLNRPQSNPQWPVAHKTRDPPIGEPVRSKSAPTADGPRTGVQIYGTKCLSRRHKENKPITPTLRHVVTEYVRGGKRPQEYFWSSPSKRLENDDEEWDSAEQDEDLPDTYGIRRRARVSFASTYVLKDSRISQEEPYSCSQDETLRCKKDADNGDAEEDKGTDKCQPTKRHNVRMFLNDKTMSRCHRQRKDTQELPIKLFDPKFPFDKRTVRQFPVPATRQTTNTSPRAFSRSSNKSVSCSGHTDNIKLNLKYTGSSQETRRLAKDIETKVMKPRMVVLGKGLQRSADRDRLARETRQKMDLFFARLDQPSAPKSSEIHIHMPQNRPNTASQETQQQDEQSCSYRRAAPWPVEVWC